MWYSFVQYILPPLFITLHMESLKPRKIFHFDQGPTVDPLAEQEHFNNRWQVIKSFAEDYLSQQKVQKKSIVNLRRSIQVILIKNQHNRLHQNLIKLFYEISKKVLEQISEKQNCLLALLTYYLTKKQESRALFDILNGFLSPFLKRDEPTIQSKLYQILCKEIVNSHISQKVGEELCEIIERFRQSQNSNQIMEIEYQLKSISFLGIFPYFDYEFLQKSKVYYIRLAQRIEKNEEIFYRINQNLNKQQTLNKILKPSESTILYLQKQLIEEYYPYMIEYTDYLIQQNKTDKLKILWSYRLRLSENEHKLFDTRIKQIIRDVALEIKEDGQMIQNILYFKHRLTNVIVSSFNSNKYMHNLLHNTIQQVLTQNEKIYNIALCNKIHREGSKYNPEIISELFKLIPNKQHFIRQLEINFSKLILQNSLTDLRHHEEALHMIKKQCGNNLCKKIDRMTYDVWRDGNMVYYFNSASNFKCRMLSLNDWPKFKYEKYTLPDRMLEMIYEFEGRFRNTPENTNKQIKWITDLGSIILKVNQVESLFWEIEAAILFILDKSIRPINIGQISQILQTNPSNIKPYLDNMTMQQVLEYNQRNMTYDINNDNQRPYVRRQLHHKSIEQDKTTEKRDDSILLDAAIVRILKRRKNVPKTQLMSHLTHQLTLFVPTNEELYQAVQRLQKKDYLQIDKQKGILRYRQ